MAVARKKVTINNVRESTEIRQKQKIYWQGPSLAIYGHYQGPGPKSQLRYTNESLPELRP